MILVVKMAIICQAVAVVIYIYVCVCVVMLGRIRANILKIIYMSNLDYKRNFSI